MQGKPRPRVQQAQNFTNHIEGVAGVPPPVSRIGAVVRSATDNCLAVFFREALPQNGGAPGVHFGSDDDDAMEIFLAKGLAEGAHFVRGVYDGRRENVDGAVRNTLMKQKQPVVKFLAGIGDGQFFEGGAGLDGIREPDLRSVALVVKPAGFERAGRHAAAENGDSGGFLRGIFLVEPAAEVEEGEQKQKEKRTGNGKNEARLASRGVGKDGSQNHLDREIIRSKVKFRVDSR